MENKGVPLRGKQLVLFGILFGGFMLFVGYTIFSDDSTDIMQIDKKIERQQGVAYAEKGFEYYEKGNYEQARQHFQSAVDKGIKESYALLGECEYILGDDKKAEKSLLEAFKAERGDEVLPGYTSGVHYNLGRVYFRVKQNDLAKEHLKQALELGNSNAGIYLDSLNQLN